MLINKNFKFLIVCVAIDEIFVPVGFKMRQRRVERVDKGVFGISMEPTVEFQFGFCPKTVLLGKAYTDVFGWAGLG
jgi:hypothetical protein